MIRSLPPSLPRAPSPTHSARTAQKEEAAVESPLSPMRTPSSTNEDEQVSEQLSLPSAGLSPSGSQSESISQSSSLSQMGAERSNGPSPITQQCNASSHFASSPRYSTRAPSPFAHTASSDQYAILVSMTPRERLLEAQRHNKSEVPAGQAPNPLSTAIMKLSTMSSPRTVSTSTLN